MAVVIKRLQAANIPVNTFTDLYRVPTGKRAILRSIYQGYDGGVVNSSMGVTMRGVGYIWDQKVSSQDHRVWPVSTVMYAGDVMQAHHSQLGQYTMLQVVEMDEVEGATLWYQQFNSVVLNQNQVYTVPAGKKLRVREVVFCNHGDRADWFMAINGIGYLAKVPTQPRVGNVIGVDMLLTAGEQLVAGITLGPSGHAFASGVLEDA